MSTQESPRPRGAAGFYLTAAMATAISADTSWRFIGERLHITALPERIGMFAVVEVTLAACAYAMRANVRRGDGPGPARMLAWSLAGLAGYMAVVLSGPVEGLARVLLGPVLGIIALHLALGIEVRARRSLSSSTWARIGREMRERALSRLGLADDERDALARTRDRAAGRAARLATTRRAPFRARRLARAVRASGVALDQDQRARMLAQVAAYRHISDLLTVDLPSPWLISDRPAPAAVPPAAGVAPIWPAPGAVPPAPAEPAPAGPSGDWSETTYANGELDGAVLAVDVPPGWASMSKTAAVTRADRLLPGRTSRALAAALSAVGVTITDAQVRAARARARSSQSAPAAG